MIANDRGVSVAPGAPNCLNCGDPSGGRFCSNCGQELQRRIETVPAFMRRIIREAGDLEGPVWRTFWSIIRHPGVLAREYGEGRFRSQVAPIRLYLVVAAASYVFFPIWNGWIRSDGSAVDFVSPLGIALAVPVWAAAAWLTLAGLGRYYEEAFVLSAHFHTVYLVLFSLAGCVMALLGVFMEPGLIRLSPLLFCAFGFPPLYVFLAFRTAFGIGRIRATLTALALGVGHILLLAPIESLLVRMPTP